MSVSTGDKVIWTSQSQGYTKTKTGTVVAIIKPEQDANLQLPTGLPVSRMKGQRYSEIERALVEVPRGGKSTLSDYYTPRISMLKRI